MPRWSSFASTPATFSAVRPPPVAASSTSAVDLDLADPCLAPAGEQADPHAALQPAAPKGPGHDRPAALDAEGAIDRQAGRAVGQSVSRDPLDERHERRSQLRDAVPGGGGHDEDLGTRETCPLEEPARRLGDLACAIGSDEVALRDDREAVRDSERVEELEVLQRLRARPVVGGHDQQRRVDLTRTHEHVADELVVPRHVDEVELRSVRQVEVGVADVDRHAPAPLLGQPVGIDAGQRAQQGRLAVVDVARGPDDDGHRPSAAPVLPSTDAIAARGRRRDRDRPFEDRG